MRGILLLVTLTATPALLVAAEPDFTKDIRPIFAKHCVSCHGAEKPRGGLRLDSKAAALAGGNSGSILVPGKSAKSPLIQRITSTDASEQMPPKGDRLSQQEIAKLTAWIDTGAKWPEEPGGQAEVWWSLQPLATPKVPAVREEFKNRVRNPIDAFILAKLEQRQLSPSPEADRRTLIRRLSYDLIGLPPTPQEVEDFLKDTRPDAYEKLVDRLLASERYGERWARHWLDVVHYGDTHGYDKDKPRPNAFPYRDYVIRALNTDKPYSRFVQEQIAGDRLYPGTTDGLVALGFLAAGPWDFIGHAELPENKIDGKVARHLDRDDMIANTASSFLSITLHCAQCHNHKFDPIPQIDYYRMQAIFAAIDRTEARYDQDPAIAVKRQSLQARKERVEVETKRLAGELLRLGGKELADLDQRIARTQQFLSALKPEYGYHSALAKTADKAKWVQLDLGKPQAIGRVTLYGCNDNFNNIGPGFGFPVRFKIEASDDAKFEVGVVLIADRTGKDVENPGITPQEFPAKPITARYVRITATQLAPRQNDYIFALAEAEVHDPAGKLLSAAASVSALDSIEAAPRWRKSNLTDGIFPPGARGGDDRAKLAREREAILARVLTAEFRDQQKKLEAERLLVQQELAKLPAQQLAYIGAVHTGQGNFVGTGGNGGKPRPIHVLSRGDVTKPGVEVGPAALSGIPGVPGKLDLPENHTEADRRAALARWITAPENPLTWRSIVNRVWQYHLGRGLVDTPNDFGRMGQTPTHPELLDWLARWFRDDTKGSLKALHKLIVTSATYRQVSTGDGGAKTDASNAYLWRMNRRKLEAEAVRDAMLHVAAKLDLTMYGPGFQDFVIDKPEHSPHYLYDKYDPESPATHRRSVYRFIVRSQSQPFMAALDCADPSLSVEKRNQSATPLQALALLNNKLAVAMARHFASRLEAAEKTLPGQLRLAIRLALGREATAEEVDTLAGYARQHGLPATCRVLFNLNEFTFVD